MSTHLSKHHPERAAPVHFVPFVLGGEFDLTRAREVEDERETLLMRASACEKGGVTARCEATLQMHEPLNFLSALSCPCPSQRSH